MFGNARYVLVCTFALLIALTANARAELMAGAAKVDITNVEAGPVNDPLYARALVIKNDDTTAVMVAVDAVAIGEIGYIKNEYLGKVRGRLEQELGIPPEHVMINASHCHGVVCRDVDERTIQAVQAAYKNLVPVKVGTGRGHEDRIMENRRLKLKNGKEVDVRHAYALPPNDEVAEVGPVDPEIGVIRFDALNGETVAVVYNFACHPIQGVPTGGNSADMTGFSSKVIEDNLSEDTIALFIQGCAGDINPAFYKPVNQPRDAEPLGNMLGLSTLQAVRNIETQADERLKVIHETISLPRADLADRILEQEDRKRKLVDSLNGTFLNLETFLPLMMKYKLSEDFPSYHAYGYLREQALKRDDLARMDATNRQHIEQYIRNIQTMEELTRINTNLRLLRKHQAQNVAAGSRTVDVELTGIRIGDCVLTTFPGELTVRIGLNIKKRSPHELTFVAGYTNGYIYYAPTAEQLLNVGRAQEDSDCILAPEWQEIYENKAVEILERL